MPVIYGLYIALCICARTPLGSKWHSTCARHVSTVDFDGPSLCFNVAWPYV